MKELKEFANLTRSQIGDSEEDVKINFIVPFLEALGHDRLNFEHKYKDIFIRKGLPKSATVIVETKKYNKPLDPEIAQLERYCKEERPLLGLLTNGDELRVYSHGWRRPTQFTDKIIYSIKRTDLKDQETCKRIFDILSRENLANDTAEDYVADREKEIREGEKDTEQERKEFDRQIAFKEKEIEELKKKKESAIKAITTKFLLPTTLTISIDHSQPTITERPKTPQTRTRASKTLLKVTLSNGETIQEPKALDTFVKTIQCFGIDRVKQIDVKSGLPFINDRQVHNGKKNVYAKVSEDCYIDSNHGTPQKKKLLDKIARQLGKKIKVEIIK